MTGQHLTIRPTNEFNVCLLGASLDVGNQGCCALAASLVKLVLDSRPNAKINLLYANRTNGVQSLRLPGRTVEINIVNCRLSPKSRLNEHIFWILLLAIIQRILPKGSLRDRIIRSNRWLNTIADADFIGEIRGGDSFSDIYGLHRFLLGILPSITVILMGRDIVLLPQTFGPFKSSISRKVARLVLSRSKQILSRDLEGIKFVPSLLGSKGEHKNIQFCPDVAFVLESILPEKPDIQPELNKNACVPLVGLNISGLLYVGGFTRNNMFNLRCDYKKFVDRILDWLMEQTDAQVLLVPHVYWSDAEGDELSICRKLRESMGAGCADRIHLVMREYDQNQIKGIIGLCDFFIGSRMHACIAALSQNIPTVGLAYSNKFYGVFQSAGLEKSVIDMRQKEPDEIFKIILDAFNHRDTTRENLKSTVPGVKQKIHDIFKTLL